MKNVLLLGDSIRLGYQNRVRELLGDEYCVWFPAENCRFSRYLLWGISDWMKYWGDPELDAAHFNAGAWDIHHATVDRQIFTPIEDYARDIARIADCLLYYTPNVCFATTTPGGKGMDDYDFNDIHTLVAPREVWNANVNRYNAAALEALKGRGVRINDLNAAIAANPDAYICPDGAHMTPEGYEVLAQLVAGMIRSMTGNA